MTSKLIQLIIVMPVYNEQDCIESTILEWLKECNKISGSEMYVINDGSIDATANILSNLEKSHFNLKIFNKPNGGHGSAVLFGYKEALAKKPEWIFQVDSDGQFKARDLFRLWDKRTDKGFLIGIRTDRKDSFFRGIITYFEKWLALLLWGVWPKDPNSPFRLMKSDKLEELLKKISPTFFAPNMALTILAKAGGAKIAEIPVRHYSRAGGIPSIKLFKWIPVLTKCVKDLFILRMASW